MIAIGERTIRNSVSAYYGARINFNNWQADQLIAAWHPAIIPNSTTLYDGGVNKLHGTCSSYDPFHSTQRGFVLSGNADADYIDCGINTLYQMYERSFTSMIWFYPTATSGVSNQFALMRHQYGGSGTDRNGAWAMDYGTWDGNDSYLTLDTFDGAWHNVLSSYQVALNVWHQIIVSAVHGGNATLCIDGVIDTSNTYYDPNASHASAKLCIGGVNYSETGYYGFRGYIGEARLYNYAMSNNQMVACHHDHGDLWITRPQMDMITLFPPAEIPAGGQPMMARRTWQRRTFRYGLC
jgi:hypothetical protein